MMNNALDVRDARRSAPQAFCERLICLFPAGGDRRWWHELIDETRPLFALDQRLVEASLEHVAEAAAAAVNGGFRPVFFVPRVSDWPAVCEALERYQSFAELYVYGRDDAAMTGLLHAPSVEVMDVYAGEGRVIVPNLEYGKALDAWMQVSLLDFRLVDAGSKRDPVNPQFQLVCRLNPYRQLLVTLYYGSAADIIQSYQRGDEQEPCDCPVRFRHWRLQFKEGKCHLIDKPELIEAIREWLETQDRDAEVEATEMLSRNTLLEKLGLTPPAPTPEVLEILRTAGIGLLKRGKQVALQLNQAAIETLYLLYPTPEATRTLGLGARGMHRAVRTRGKPATRGPARELPPKEQLETLRETLQGRALVVATMLHRQDQDIVMAVKWLGNPPLNEPRVLLQVKGQRVPSAARWSRWSAGGSPKQLRIESCPVSEKEWSQVEVILEMYWQPEDNTLHIHLLPEQEAE